MTILTIVLVSTLVLVTLLQLPSTVKFLALLRRSVQSSPSTTSAFCPKTSVILCLRGADPSLARCLTGLMQQDYPDYQVQIIVDSEHDPAWDYLKPILQNPKFRVSVLQNKLVTCGLKCSALLQAVAELPADREVVALIDADTIPHATWLRELVAPLVDPAIGATTGNRWYIPNGKQWGTIARYVQNVGAVVGMYHYQVAWAGSLAFRAAYLREPDLLDAWATALVEDTPLCQFLRARQLRVEFVPSLLMVNDEECTFPRFVRWLTRQLVNTRLYHPDWEVLAGFGIISAVTPIITAIVFGLALVAQQPTIAFWAGAGLLIFALLGVMLPTLLIEQRVNQVIAAQGNPLPPIDGLTWFKKTLMIPAMYWICAVVLIRTMLTQSIEWRGITYQIRDPQTIHVTEYLPYQPLQFPTQQSKISL